MKPETETINYAEKTKQWLKLHGRGSVVATMAAKGYQRHGRGHVMVICKKNKLARKHKVETFQYITQQHNRHMVSIDPLAEDPQLDKMVAEYDPTKEAIVLAFWGAKYLRLTIPIAPTDADEWPDVIGGEQ